jgi:hypothetical protein
MSKNFDDWDDDFDVSEDEFSSANTKSASETAETSEDEVTADFNNKKSLDEELNYDEADDEISDDDFKYDNDYSEEAEDVIPRKKSKTPVVILCCFAVLAIIGIVTYLVLDGMGIIGKKSDGLVSLGNYKDYTYDAYVVATPSDADVEDYYNSIFDYYSSSGYAIYNELPEKADDEVAEGDTVNIDYTGYLDGEAFDGGTATGYNLTIGSNTFVGGFEDALIGHKPGETFDISVTFPETYSLNEDLAGAETIFTVTINYFSEAEPMYVTAGYDSLEDCYADIRDYLYQDALSGQSDYKTECMNNYIQSVIDASEFTDLTDKIDALYNTTYTSLESYYTAQGYDLSTVASSYGYDSVSELQTELKAASEDSVKMQLVLTEIAKLEGLDFTDEIYQQTAQSYIGDDSVSVDDFQTSYDAYSGEGRFRELMFESYVIEQMFTKYAKEESAED